MLTFHCFLFAQAQAFICFPLSSFFVCDYILSPLNCMVDSANTTKDLYCVKIPIHALDSQEGIMEEN